MPSVIEDILDVVDGKIMAVNTAIPGAIAKYATSGKAEVQPLVKLKYADGAIITPPVITNVVVVQPRTAGGSLTLPIAVGDPVLLIFSQWSIDRWASEGTLVEAGDARHHSMSDAFAIPGAFSFKDGPTGETGTVLKDGNTKVKLTGEKVAIGNAVAELLSEVVTALNATGNSNCVNGAPLTQSAAILAAAAKIESIRGTL
jgi:hypothetical protein